MGRKSSVALLWIADAAIIVSVTGVPAAEKQGVDPETLFETSDKCLACHNGMASTRGENVSIGSKWRSTMMAHSSKDPYWHAGVRRETLEHPKAKAAIEDKCSTCHMPMARFVERESGRKGEVLKYVEPGVLSKESRLERFVEDGVSCAVCHQVRSDNFGKDESYDGGFVVDTKQPLEERIVFGPFKIAEATQRVMRTATGFVPTQSEHVRKSELCATCHTLYTHALDSNGQEVAELAEQVPYLEWLHSDYRDSMSCQECHMAAVEGAAPISSVLGKPREGAAEHRFRGGNFLLLQLIDGHRHTLGIAATPEELEATRRSTLEHLTTESASVVIEATAASVDEGSLRFPVTVENLAGHKLPTAYPSRRVWLHVTVKDGSGNAIFESGALRDDGAITGNDNDADALRFEPHYTEITSGGQVQIYESIIGDPSGAVTTGLLSAARYLKDNRVLPAGFDKATAEPDVAVFGGALDDASFEAGRDHVVFRIPVAGAAGPFTVTAALWYQPIGYRWAMNLASVKGTEPQRFMKMYRAMPGRDTAVRLADTTAVIAPAPEEETDEASPPETPSTPASGE